MYEGRATSHRFNARGDSKVVRSHEWTRPYVDSRRLAKITGNYDDGFDII